MPTPLLSPAGWPAAAPQRGGLLSAAVPGENSIRWTSGVMVWPESEFGWELSELCSTETVEHGNVKAGQAPLAGVPYVIRTSVECPGMWNFERMADRVRARMEAITSRAMARELMLGELSKLDPYTLSGGYDWLNPADGGDWTNPYLTETGGDVLDPIADPLEALYAVEAAVGALLTAGPVYLHVPVTLIGSMALGLEKRGDLLTTLTGGIVVADYGYPPPDPPADPEDPPTPLAIYGTGPVVAWAGDTAVENTPGEVLHTADNTVRVYAERPALALFDPQTLVSVSVAEPTP